MLLEQDASIVTEGIENLQKVDKNVVRQYLESMVPGLIDFGVQIVLAVLLFIIGKQVIMLLRKILRKSLDHRGADTGVCQFLDSFSKYILYFLLWIMILTLFGVTTASVIAVLGSAGLTLGLALQGSLANFAGGVLILLLKPFRVEDYIFSKETGLEGTVKEITTFYTKLLTVDNQTVIIPNGKLADNAVINATGQKTRKMNLMVGISYESDLRQAKKLLAGIVEVERRVLKDQPVEIFVNDLKESGVELGCRFWVKTDDYWQTRWDTLEAIKLLFDEYGVVIPYPQMDVHVKGMENAKINRRATF